MRPRMSARRLVPGQTHSITRRVAGRRFLLRPCEFVNQVVLYALGRACMLYPTVKLHALLTESNHEHVNCTDGRTEDTPPSEIPEFFQCLHRLIAAALNTHYGLGGGFWERGSYDNVEIHSLLSVEQQLLYLWTNAVLCAAAHKTGYVE